MQVNSRLSLEQCCIGGNELISHSNIKLVAIIVFITTIPYSPEILQHLPYGEKADIWAAGCLLYQMATLDPPFYSSNLLQLATKVNM